MQAAELSLLGVAFMFGLTFVLTQQAIERLQANSLSSGATGCHTRRGAPRGGWRGAVRRPFPRAPMPGACGRGTRPTASSTTIAANGTGRAGRTPVRLVQHGTHPRLPRHSAGSAYGPPEVRFTDADYPA
jgi:hypothetical protein